MNINRELGSVRDLLEDGLGDGETERNNLLDIRERLWNVQIALQERAAEKDAKLEQLKKLRIENQACLIGQDYIEKDIERMKKLDFSGSSEMDLVDVETFKKDNPDCPVDEQDENLFMMERFKDEQERRIQLFSRRIELSNKIKGVQERLNKLRISKRQVLLFERYKPLHNAMKKLDEYLNYA